MCSLCILHGLLGSKVRVLMKARGVSLWAATAMHALVIGMFATKKIRPGYLSALLLNIFYLQPFLTITITK
jgi:hypothetical protein